jgi:enolase-phosphatase E1
LRVAGVIKAIVTDIEGTTTALSFVQDELFPYARARIAAFVRARLEDPVVKEALEQSRALAAEEQGVSPQGMTLEEIIRQLERWIDEDRKITPLKQLQGMIWERGYRDGELFGHLYPDAVTALRAWHQQGIALYVYSSGSIHAQKLLFAHTAAGDLTPLFSGYFDTTTGAKREGASYRRIAAAIGLPAEEILFLSDIEAELDAAREAGMQTCQLVREDALAKNPAHRQARDFSDLG